MEIDENSFFFEDGRRQLYKVSYIEKESWLLAPDHAGGWRIVRKVTSEAELEEFMSREVLLNYKKPIPIIQEIGRNFFLVGSVTRADVQHVVDMEPNAYGSGTACSCEQNRLRKESCQHILLVEAFIEAARRRQRRLGTDRRVLASR